jgi:hypothetical protein
VTGGGFWAALGAVDVWASAREGNGWSVTGYGAWEDPGSAPITAFAVCLHDEDVASFIVEGSRSVEEGSGMAVMAGPCPADTILTGGGFRLGFAGVVEAMNPTGGQWRVYVRNSEGTGGPVYAVSEAVCLGLRA